MKKIIGLMMVCFSTSIDAQTVKVVASGTKTSMRGLSVVDDNTVWVSGSSGRVARSTDGGTTWKWMTVKGFEKADFRDIEAFDSSTAVIMGIADPAYLLRTTDGGETWQTVYENKAKGMFLDAMEFWDKKTGFVIGDPIDNHFFVALTLDGGMSWQEIKMADRPIADSGEACFASSGTNIKMLSNKDYIFITGGLVSNVVTRNKKIRLPLIQGKESTGANSIAVKNKKTWIVVGGDFTTKDSTTKNAAYTVDAGKSWQYPTVAPTGYRSAVEFLKNKTWICCGLNGVDITNDDGNVFSNISKEGFHVVRKAKKGTAVYFGGGGKIGKLVF